ncbi:MAG: signal peptidase II [Deltaproteobacteria bacterium]|nr:signal peptidase II [Deltaproteobacteria bacterium]
MKLNSYIKWGLFFVLPCYLFDQLTKWLICSHFKIGQGVSILPGFFEIIHVRNTGAAFGILRGIPEAFRTPFFVIVTLLACVAILFMLRETREHPTFLKITFCLILTGALGNLTDRLRLNEVIDFIHIHVGRYHWPTFNIADTCISIGIVCLILYTIITAKKEQRQ